MEKLKQLDNNLLWQRRWVQAVLGMLAFGLAYALGSFALDSGSLMQWSLTVFWIVVGMRELLVSVLPHKKLVTVERD